MLASPDPFGVTAGLMNAWMTTARSMIEMQTQATAQTVQFWTRMAPQPQGFGWMPSTQQADPFGFWKMSADAMGPWPLACGMMACGVPSTYAWPAAQMQTQMMSTFNTAARAFEAPFSSYQSGNGFATSQVWPSAVPQALNPFAAFMPAPKPVFNPWKMWGF